MKKNLLMVAFVIVFAIATAISLFLPIPTGFKIAGLIWVPYFFFNLKYARQRLDNPWLRLMWGLAGAAVYILPAYFGDGWVFAGSAGILIIQRFAPAMGEIFGFNETSLVEFWSGTITDEGEIIGMDKRSQHNAWLATFLVVGFIGLGLMLSLYSPA